jgi:hypothetical protein
MTRASVIALETKITATKAAKPTAYIFISIHQYASISCRDVAECHVETSNGRHVDEDVLFGESSRDCVAYTNEFREATAPPCAT